MKHRIQFLRRRREFISLLGGAAAAWPVAARAQQGATPVVGLLSGRWPKDSVANVIAFKRGLGELGYFDGQNVEIDFRWALGHYDQLPALAADTQGDGDRCDRWRSHVDPGRHGGDLVHSNHLRLGRRSD